MYGKLATIVLLFSLLSISSYGQIRLQYNLKIGDSILIHQKANQIITQNVDGSNHEMTNNLESKFVFIVKKATDSSYISDFYFKLFKLESTSNLYGEIMSVNTAAPVAPDDIEAAIFSGLTNAILKVELLKTGKIKSIQGTTQMITKMLKNSGITDEYTREIMIEEMKKEFGNKSLSDSFEQLTYIYPKQKVAIGSTWKNKYSGDLQAENLWTLQGINANLELIAIAKVSMESTEDTYKMVLNGEQKTHVLADIKTGIVKTMSVTSKTQGNTVSLQNNSVKIPTSIYSITTYKTKLYVQ